ncbi:MAG: N(4)-(beta-N-acetylglucosaminyl)-L-asparaginase [Capsulimonas sp.]|uniref:N(4)-(beta-N-acetylglucosaminyl)-L-asparaginase n=1 Tax=Capsulimonas sp. TaxID=2494211 RepID=UPI0032654900
MLVVASENGKVGIGAAMEILRAGGSALDAVEAATREVERNEHDHSVGVGGYPNILGEVELDASIMEGATRQAGAVAAIRGYPHPISVARAILDKLPHHVLLAGEGAAQFAAEHGFEPMTLLTPEAEAAWRRVTQRPGFADAPLTVQARMAQDPEKTVGTVDFLALDDRGHIASAVSTSGWAFKYPGRVGDSPIIGAGNYCDDRYGACACTGLGELSIRASLARMTVAALARGLSVSEACHETMADLALLPLPATIPPAMSMIAIDRHGNHGGFTLAEDLKYVWQDGTMEEARIEERTRVLLG